MTKRNKNRTISSFITRLSRAYSCQVIYGYYTSVFFLQVPVGRATLGRIMNVIGEPIDGNDELSKIITLTLHIRFLFFLNWNCMV